MIQRKTLRQRFELRYTPEPNSGCWLWDGCTDQGYGILHVPGLPARAHRAAWELHRGPIPSGLVLDHICRTRCCVNPDHLRLVTNKENVLHNSASLPALNASKTHCAQGHPLSGGNLIVQRYRSRNGRNRNERTCRECRRIADVRRRQRRKEEA